MLMNKKRNEYYEYRKRFKNNISCKEESKENVECKKNSLAKYINTFGLLGMIVPSFYLIGLLYYKGTLSAYGIQSESFPLDSYDVYVYAFYAVIPVITKLFSWASAIIEYVTTPWVLIVVIVIYIILHLKNNENVYCIVQKHQESILNYLENNIFFDSIKLFYIGISSFLAVLIIPLFITIFLISLPYAAYKKGQDIQMKDVQKFHQDGCYKKEDGWSNCIEVYNSKKVLIAKGLLISISSKKIAIYKKDGSHLIELKSDYEVIHPFLEDTRALESVNKSDKTKS